MFGIMGPNGPAKINLEGFRSLSSQWEEIKKQVAEMGKNLLNLSIVFILNFECFYQNPFPDLQTPIEILRRLWFYLNK